MERLLSKIGKDACRQRSTKSSSNKQRKHSRTSRSSHRSPTTTTGTVAAIVSILAQLVRSTAASGGTGCWVSGGSGRLDEVQRTNIYKKQYNANQLKIWRKTTPLSIMLAQTRNKFAISNAVEMWIPWRWTFCSSWCRGCFSSWLCDLVRGKRQACMSKHKRVN